ncbi:MAG: CoA transferase, partial [Proteobacteria bacterium]|nr:CoA transferase [Pseudomonadota bacterium]
MTTESGSRRPQGASLNELLYATSFLFGTNAPFIEGLYAQYLEDPGSVDGTWRAFFEALGEHDLSPTQLGRGPSWRRDAKVPFENGELVRALSGDARRPFTRRAARRRMGDTDSHIPAQDSIRAIQLVRAYRVIGHLEANLDPLGLERRQHHPQLQPSFYGFRPEDMERPVFTDGVMGLESSTPRQIVQLLQRTYCGNIGYEFMHINDPERKDWLQRRIEGPDKGVSFTPKGKKAILNKLVADADVFIESFRPGVMKRLGIDYDTLRKINPGLVYCSIAAFGQTGPMRDQPAHDTATVALAGVSSITRSRGGAPAIIGIATADMLSAQLAFGGIMMALFRQRQTGEGDYVDISMHDSLLAAQPNLMGPVFAENRPPVLN